MSRPLLCSALAFALAATPLPAAISVSGVADAREYDADATFTVDQPAGYATTATLDGQSVPLGAPVTVATAGFHELHVQQTPDAGGEPETATFRFVVIDDERGGSETGLPPFIPFPLVDDAPSAVATGSLKVIAPRDFPDHLPLPLIYLLQRPDGAALWLNTKVDTLGPAPHRTQLRRGYGYSLLSPPHAPGQQQRPVTAGTLSTTVTTTIEPAPAFTAVSGTIASDTEWPAAARVHVTGNLSVAAGATLTIRENVVVQLDPGVDIEVDGTVDILATPGSPTTFVPAVPGDPWGGFFLREETSRLTATGAIFTGSGADDDWYDNNSGGGSHRDEQSLFHVQEPDPGDLPDATLVLTDCYLIGNAGQLLHNEDAVSSLTRCLLQGAPSSGQNNGGRVTITDSALLGFPDFTGHFEDGDQDAIYLTDGNHTLTRTVIGWTKDDGIDTGGSPSRSSGSSTTVDGCWFESIFHDAIACSGEKTVTASGTVFINCGQTLEAGYDSPHTTLESSLAAGNLVGVRRGDNYDWDYDDTSLTATGNVLVHNFFRDVWGYDWSSWSYRTDQMDVTGNILTSGVGRHPDNTTFDPGQHAALIAPFMPVPGSDVGVALVGAAPQSPASELRSTYEVRLSTFSSKPVSVGFLLEGKTDPTAATSVELAAGQLTFSPGETLKSIALPADPTPYPLVRLCLESPTNAEITGGEAWFFGGADSTPQQRTLVPDGSVWAFSADRTQPPAGWQLGAFDDSAWRSGPAQIGFDENDEETLLTPAEAGPDDDRTRTVYFRHRFQLTDPASLASLQLELLRDDGAVVYLNGTEIARDNMPAGAVTYDTFASSSVTGGAEDEFHEQQFLTGPLALLVPGTNTLAVEVHQRDLDSSDLSFDLRLTATTAPPNDTALTTFRGDTFFYWLDPAATLQRSGDLTGWRDDPLATSPLLLPTAGSATTFFRTRRGAP